MTAKEAFDIWWKAYPKKVGKRIAEKRWMYYYSSMPELDHMIKLLEAQKRTPQWLKDEGEYIPHPATYINQGRYEDELKVELPKDIVNEKPWHETASGIEAKGAELGLFPDDFNTWPQFKTAVMQKSLKAA